MHTTITVQKIKMGINMGIYKKYGEEIGYEGKSRDEIMKMVLESR